MVPPDAPRAASAAVRSPTPQRSLVAAVGGNRCGHLPSAPQFHQVHLPEDANPFRPLVIRKAIVQVDVYYYHVRQQRWDALSQSERHARIRRQLHDQAAQNERDPAAREALAQRLARWRQPRSERREAVVCVLKLLLAYTDLKTLTIAVPQGDAWLGLNAPWIAEHTGLSVSRVKRALATLARAGWVTNTGRGRRYDRRQRRWVGVGWGPVRQFSWHAVRALKLEVAWQRAQRKAHKEHQAAQRRPAPATPLATAVSTLLPPAPLSPQAQREHTRTLRQTLNPHSSEATRTADPATLERNRRLAELAAEGFSPAEIRHYLKTGPPKPD